MKLAINIPELKLNDCQKKTLLATFHDNKDNYGHLYTTSTGNTQDLLIVGGFEDDHVMEYLKDFIPAEYVDAGYFISNRGIEPHIDDDRQCILSFELQNHENIPVTFTDGDIDVYYNGDTLMWNPQVKHQARTSKDTRIFYQIELNRDHTYEFYAEQYLAGNLIKTQ